MPQTRMEGDMIVVGTLTPQALNCPAGAIDDKAVKAAAGIEATKLQHQHTLLYQQPDGADITAAVIPLWIVRGQCATVVDVEVFCSVAPAGGDKQFSVDLQRCKQGDVKTSILAAPIVYSASKADHEIAKGTISIPGLVDNQALLVVIGVSGSTGAQGQGLLVTVTVREDAE